jgi:3-oxoacyl-[acyl-carrier protein] reductase
VEGHRLKNISDLSFSEIAIGQTFTLLRTIAEKDIDAFAEVSGDFSPLHMDKAYACATEFGNRVVHGAFLASLFSNLIGMQIPGRPALYLGQELVFRRPVLLGDTVIASAKVISKSEATQTIVLATEVRTTSDDKVVVSGTAKVKVRGSKSLPAVPKESVQEVAPHTDDRRVAIVTGSSRGIGAEIAKTLARNNVNVVVNYFRNNVDAMKVVEEIEASKGRAVAVQADVRDEHQVRLLVDSTIRHFGKLDCLVNCAVGELELRSMSDLAWTRFQDHLDYQVKAVFLLCQLAYPYLKASDNASIVNIVSQVTDGAPPSNMADYVAAKYALKGLSKSMASEWACDGIRVNTVSPGLVQTDLTQHFNDRVFKMEASRTPLKRLALPADVANAVVYLLGNQASFITGFDISITGGQVMR